VASNARRINNASKKRSDYLAAQRNKPSIEIIGVIRRGNKWREENIENKKIERSENENQ